jgi:hypothetical protein
VRFLPVIFSVVLLGNSLPAVEQDQFTRLFDGKTFDGWEGDLRIFRIEDDAVVGGSLKQPVARNEFLSTKKAYTDFELRLKFKLLGKGANGGVQIRSQRVPNSHEMIGCQADLGEGCWGSLYDESRRKTVLAGPPAADRDGIVHNEDWNDYVIRCEGRRIQLWVNGHQTVDYTEPDAALPQAGVIGLQIHGGLASEAWYKDIRIKDLAVGHTDNVAGTKVFLLAGQSNMEGCGGGYNDDPLPAPYKAPQPTVKYWSEGGWIDLRGGFGDTASTFGPEVTFGYILHRRVFPTEDIYLVKYAVGGTNLAVRWKPDGSGDCYNAFKSRVTAAMKNLAAAGKSPKIVGMIWMQGETDACFSGFASAYAANLATFVAKVRSDFAAPKMRFVLGRITKRCDTTPPGGGELVRNAQVAAAEKVDNVSWVNTDDLETNPGRVGHYGTQGQIELGERFASQFMKLRSHQP